MLNMMWKTVERSTLFSFKKVYENKKIKLMFLISFIVMLLISYTTLYTFDHYTFSTNKLYMAILMTSTMGVINTILMGEMFKTQKIRFGIMGSSILLVLISFLLIRTQGFVGDEEFLRSMIPHHSAAIQVCENAKLSNPKNVELCEEIIKAQEREIEIMKDYLDN